MRMPIIALRGLTVLPGMVVHFDASRKKSIEAAQGAMLTDQKVVLMTQKNADVEDPQYEDLCHIGVLIRIKQLLKVQGNVVRIMVEGLERVELMELEDDGKCYWGDIEFRPRASIATELDYCTQEALLRTVKEDLQRFGAENPLGKQIIPQLLRTEKLDELLIQIGISIPFENDSKQIMLECETYRELCEYIEHLICQETMITEIKRDFQQKVKERLDKSQREYILREQMRVIRQELGEDGMDADLDEYQEKLAKLKAPKEVKEKIAQEIKRLKAMPGGSQEGTVSRTYIETLLELPWNKMTRDHNDTKRAMDILEEDHYGLKDVKERIVDFLAVRSMAKKGNSPIICLAGPPGTGKTSIAQSIARALGKKYVRVCLGGVRDEAEIRGHRRTYIGAMPGRIADGLKQAGSSNPLMLLDEIDKVSSDYKGDTSSALLEVLDSAQNSKFRDHYVELPLDLSHVLFIATANNLHNIPAPLLDRMEVIEVNSYTLNEKYHIAVEHLLPKQMEKHGLKPEQLTIEKEAIQKIIHSYTREAGVRNLERKLAEVCRKAVREILEEEVKAVRVDSDKVEKYLGQEKVSIDRKNEEDAAGIVRGLAWTSVGGTTLEVEVSIIPGSGKFKLTGQIGDVMKESANIAMSYVRSVAPVYEIDKAFFDDNDVHLHIPEGAVPKDGPSAGITMATAILSAATDKKVHADLAMTGEVTLRGRVLPIGGLKEKLLAAKMADIHHVLVPAKNQPDVAELSEEITDDIDITYVKTMDEVLVQSFV